MLVELGPSLEMDGSHLDDLYILVYQILKKKYKYKFLCDVNNFFYFFI